MTRTTSVSSHTRRLPEKAPDPLAPVMEAKRPAFQRKWGMEDVLRDQKARTPRPWWERRPAWWERLF